MDHISCLQQIANTWEMKQIITYLHNVEKIEKKDINQSTEELHVQMYWHREDHANFLQLKGRDHGKIRL